MGWRKGSSPQLHIWLWFQCHQRQSRLMEEGEHQTSRHTGLDACSVQCVCGRYGQSQIGSTCLIHKRVCILKSCIAQLWYILYIYILTVLYIICMPACKLNQTWRTCTLNNSHTRSMQLYIGQHSPETLSFWGSSPDSHTGGEGQEMSCAIDACVHE